ncbi:hypothetical protein F5B20DRAFT_586621 [Whalleya microplaca]|nr:hypothetical protein F5B20DRAFT_586621 [Whalleya microplaca]
MARWIATKRNSNGARKSFMQPGAAGFDQIDGELQDDVKKPVINSKVIDAANKKTSTTPPIIFHQAERDDIVVPRIQTKDSPIEEPRSSHVSNEPRSSGSTSQHPISRPDGFPGATISVRGSKAKKIFQFLEVHSSIWTREQYEERFDFVSNELKKAVDSSKFQHLANMTDYWLRMVGTTQETAIPSIVIICNEKDKKNLQKLFNPARDRLYCKKGSSEFCLFKKTRPPKPPFRLIYHTAPMVKYGSEDNDSALVLSEDTLCGALIQHQGRKATIGLVLEVDGVDRALTVDHLFHSNQHPEQQETISRHATTSRSQLDDVTLNDEDFVSLDALWDGDADGGVVQPALSSAAASNSSTITRVDVCSISSHNWVILGSRLTEPPFGVNTTRASTDSALVSLDEGVASRRYNSFRAHPSSPPGTILQKVADNPRAHGVPVYMVSGVRGVVVGHLLRSPTYVGSRPGQDLCKTWTVVFDSLDGIIPGECGSIIVDQETLDTLADLKERYNASSIRLPTAPQGDTSSHYSSHESCPEPQDTSSGYTEALESLNVPSMNMGRERIQEAHKNTLQWVFEDSQEHRSSNFAQWLKQDRGIFWISGKPGSGKSTLVKFLQSHPRTKQTLQTWAAPKGLLVASHFFFHPGGELQRSGDGLLRTLLYQMLSQSPSLFKHLALGRPRLMPFPARWTSRELLRAFGILSSKVSQDFKLCLFIDGLDEYDGDHGALLDTLFSICMSPHIKICVSSRPERIFIDRLGVDLENTSVPITRLSLDEFNLGDIRRYVGDNFSRVQDALVVERMTETIVSRADGVFLWVFLAVKYLLHGLDYGTLNTALTRLDRFPPGLFGLYAHMVDSIASSYRAHSQKMFQIVMAARNPLPLSAFDRLGDFKDFTMTRWTGPAWSWGSVAKRLSYSSAGLLETNFNGSHEVITFIHYSVRDYLLDNLQHARLPLSGSIDLFDPDIYISRILTVMVAYYMPEVGIVSTEEIMAILDEIGYHIRQVERRQNASKSDLVDDMLKQLEVALQQCHNFDKFQNSLLPGWQDKHGDGQDYALGFAVYHGLCRYVERQLLRQRAIVNGIPKATNTYPLLSYALWNPDRSSGSRKYENVPEIVQLLLDRGADFSCRLCGEDQEYSVWEAFISDLREVISYDSDSLAHLMGQMKIEVTEGGMTKNGQTTMLHIKNAGISGLVLDKTWGVVMQMLLEEGACVHIITDEILRYYSDVDDPVATKFVETVNRHRSRFGSHIRCRVRHRVRRLKEIPRGWN